MSEEVYSPIFRSKNLAKGDALLKTLDPNVQTLWDIMKVSSNKYKDRKCMGTRKLIKMWQKDVNGKKFNFPELSKDLTWKNYGQVFTEQVQLSGGIHDFSGVRQGGRIGIYLDTCPEWNMCANACFRLGITVVTSYANLGFEALVHVIGETQLACMVCPPENVEKLEKVASKIPSLKKLIIVGGERKSDLFECVRYEELVKSSTSVPEALTKPEDMAVIMYTSGSTGMPKGVLLTHLNVLSGCSAVGIAAKLSKDDTFLGYLPLAHIFELACEWAFLAVGGCIGYGSPRTLSGKGVGPLNVPVDKRVGDILAVAPTMLAGVPRVWDTIRKGVQEQVANGSFLKRYLFGSAYNAKLDAIYKGQTTPWWDWLVFSKVKAKLGGRLRLLVSGGAPLSKETQEFLKICFSDVVIQGYGLTETCASCTVQNCDPSDFAIREAGEIVDSCEVRLRDIPAMGYKSTDKPFPRGEVQIRGNNVSQGYFNLPKKTSEVFSKDGWFSTGDVGMFDTKRKALKIIDRIKNITKLSSGEYVPLEELEMLYGANCPFIAPNGLCIYADSQDDFAVGLCVLAMPYVTRWCKENNVSTANIHKSDKLKKAIIADLDSIARKYKRAKYERIPKLALMQKEFNPEDGTLTASMKLQRRVIYADRGGLEITDKGPVRGKGSVLEALFK